MGDENPDRDRAKVGGLLLALLFSTVLVGGVAAQAYALSWDGGVAQHHVEVSVAFERGFRYWPGFSALGIVPVVLTLAAALRFSLEKRTNRLAIAVFGPVAWLLVLVLFQAVQTWSAICVAAFVTAVAIVAYYLALSITAYLQKRE